MLDAGNRTLRVLPDRHSLLGCGADDISCQGSLSEVEGSALKKSNRRMLRLRSAILDGLSNPGRLSKAAIYFVMERATRKPASVPHLPVSSSLAEPSTTTFFISSMRCNRLHCMLRHFFGCDKYHFGYRYASSFWDRWLLWLWLFLWSGRVC